MRVTVWAENYHELHDPAIREVYPEGIHGAIADGLAPLSDSTVTIATQDMPEHGLSDDVLLSTDVLLWWGHIRQHLVDDTIAEKVAGRVRGGMGLIALHSAMTSKPFLRLMGTSCAIDSWRHGGRELIWTADPGHPIAKGVPNPLVIAQGEMYGEPFDVPIPESTVFITSYEGGEVLRSGLTYRRGAGRIFYFASGHEEYPIYRDENVRRVLRNAVQWASPSDDSPRTVTTNERGLGWFE